MGVDGTTRMAHKVARLLYCRDPLTLTSRHNKMNWDHLCRVRSCVNPAHLELISVKQNVMRGTGLTAMNAKKTHCPSGHEYTPANTYIFPDGVERKCRECLRAKNIKRKTREMRWTRRLKTKR